MLASLLEAKGIPATLVGSFDHLWVDYPGKHATAAENVVVAIAQQQADGTYRFRWPELVDWRRSWAIERAYFWDSMPASRVALLVVGWLIIGGRYHGRWCLHSAMQRWRIAVKHHCRRAAAPSP